MTHEPTRMVYSHRSNQKHTHSTKHGPRERNHWFGVWKCPVCGLTASRKRQPIVCKGTDDAPDAPPRWVSVIRSHDNIKRGD